MSIILFYISICLSLPISFLWQSVLLDSASTKVYFFFLYQSFFFSLYWSISFSFFLYKSVLLSFFIRFLSLTYVYLLTHFLVHSDYLYSLLQPSFIYLSLVIDTVSPSYSFLSVILYFYTHHLCLNVTFLLFIFLVHVIKLFWRKSGNSRFPL